MKRYEKRAFRARQVLEAFRSLPAVLDRPVSLQDVGHSIGISRTLVHRHAVELIEAGLLRSTPGAARSWRVIETTNT